MTFRMAFTPTTNRADRDYQAWMRSRRDARVPWRIHGLMARGYGVEDIAQRLNLSLASVRAEADLCRLAGWHDWLYTGRRA